MAASATEITTHLATFRGLLHDWTSQEASTTGFSTPPGERAVEITKNVLVAFRTRPPLDGEAESKFHAIQDSDAEEQSEPEDRHIAPCIGITIKSAEPGVVVAHVPGRKWNGYTLAHKEFRADLAFGPDVENEEVYQRAVVANDIIPLAISGGVGCILAYGQTSTGKTHTMEGIEACISRDLFNAAHEIGKRLAPESPEHYQFSVTFLELLGKRATDLLDAEGPEVAIQEDTIGNVRPRLKATIVQTSEELQTLITSALSHRRVTATDRNAASSRSHAVLTIGVKNTLLPYAEEGQLILVDLAGSERHEDSKGHDKQRMKESRENNESLMNLKECVRAKARMANEDGFVHIPWRSNKLTMLLKPLFDIESHQPSRAVIIAHVSPHIQDSVHSTNTLSYASPFLTGPPKPSGPVPYDPRDPRSWDTTQTRDFLNAQFTGRINKLQEAERKVQARHGKPATKTAHVDVGLNLEVICPDGCTGRNLGTLYTVEFVGRCLDARTNTSGGKAKEEALKKMAVEVSARLCHLITMAKTKSRNEIMKSRKVLSKEVYKS